MAPPSTPGIESVGESAALALRPQQAPQRPSAPAPAEAAAPPEVEAPSAADSQPKRLLIEEIGHTGRFVYKLLDPVTGDVVVQLPREEVVKLSELDTYAAGAVVNTKA